MNPVLLFVLSSFNKKQLAVVFVSLAVIVALPFVAVFSLGTDALSYLANSSSSDTVYAVSTEVQGFYQGPEIEGDTYAWGNCTYWAFALRLKNGNPIPTTWGNANTWDDYALADGYVVNHTPAVGAVYQTDEGRWGHVAYVSKVDSASGEWTISEMNAQGLNVVSTRTFKAEAALFANFIHDKVKNNGN